jgi:hypothetical protein
MNKSQPSNIKEFVLDVDGASTTVQAQEMPADFIAWNLGQRQAALRGMLARAEDAATPVRSKHGGGAHSFGAHLPVVATNNPKGSSFPINLATKGVGFVAKDEYLDYYIDKFHSVHVGTQLADTASDEERGKAIKARIVTILEFYEDTEKIDLRCLAGLEIWPGGTSLNFERDPRVSLHFLGMATKDNPHRYHQYQVNCVWEKTEPNDKRYKFGVALRQLTMGGVGRSFVPGHVPVENTPIKGKYPNGWILWAVETFDKGIDALHDGR